MENKLNITLPKGAYMVLPDEQEEKSAGGIILGEEDKKIPIIGTIVYVGEGLEKYLGKRVRFRGSYAEFIELDKVPHMFFRDLNSSIYYLLEDDKN